MGDSGKDGVDVLSGLAGPDLRWVVRASGSDHDFMTMLYVSRDGRMLAGSGFGGPKLYEASVINEWRGRTDDLPYFVMVRVHPSVDRVVATSDRGTEVDLALSEPIAQFGLRFGAAALPDGEGPATIRAEIEGHAVQTAPQPMPRRS